jgi:hypothetical protein
MRPAVVENDRCERRTRSSGRQDAGVTAEPDTEDAERLSLAIVLGTQSLID